MSESERCTDGDHRLADDQRAGCAKIGRLQTGRSDLDEGEVIGVVLAYDRGWHLVAVAHLHGDLRRPGGLRCVRCDDVVVGQDVAVAAQHEPDPVPASACR